MIRISEPQIGEEEIAAVREVLESGRLAQGPKVAEFEEAFAVAVGARYAVAVSSGTAALHAALLAHGVGPGDEVVTTPFTFVATASAIAMCGARPVFADVEEETGNIDGDRVGQALTERTAAVVPVHLYGHPADIRRIKLRISDYLSGHKWQEDIIIVYDACQAIGASFWCWWGLGALGTSCWSLYASKNITTGEGGVVTTNDEGMARRLRLIRSHCYGDYDGRTYRHVCLGYNYRMTEVQAAIGLCQLRKLPELQARRAENARYLSANLRHVRLPTVAPGCVHGWHQYTVRVPGGPERRDALQRHLRGCDIEARVYYPTPLHLQPVFEHLGYGRGDFPVAERLAGEVLSLPVHPGLSRANLDRIVETVNGWKEWK